MVVQVRCSLTISDLFDSLEYKQKYLFKLLCYDYIGKGIVTVNKSAVAAHDNPGAATIGVQTQWLIDLQKFADQGINLADIDKIAIGLGTQSDVTTQGGSGDLFIDDIMLLRAIEQRKMQ